MTGAFRNVSSGSLHSVTDDAQQVNESLLIRYHELDPKVYHRTRSYLTLFWLLVYRVSSVRESLMNALCHCVYIGVTLLVVNVFSGLVLPSTIFYNH